MPSTLGQHEHTIELAAEALLREYPDALVCGLASDGLIVEIPKSVTLWGQAAIEGRAAYDVVVAADRKAMVDAWLRAKRVGAGEGKVRMLKRPSRWMTLHFLNLLEADNIMLCILIPTDEEAGEEETSEEPQPATPRFSTLLEDEGGTVLDCDEAFTQMFGFTAAELIGQHVLDQIHPDDQARAVEGWLTMLSTRRTHQMRCRRKRKDGSWMWIDTSLHNFLNQPDRNHVLVEIIDVSAEMAALHELELRATIDTLTQCFNRHSILGELERELEQGDSEHTAVIYLDLDGFKTVNDTLGHAAGDELLVLVAERLKVASRDGDDIGRLGGDEFLVLLRGIPGPDVAMHAAQRMCEAIANSFELSSGTAELRASAGIACADTDARTGEQLVQRADAAMYQSKDEGRGQPVLAAGSQSPIGLAHR
jgi:diguanylate cyclase (GGDEF)-like protein/PAS domain S-box-containing protein